MVDGARRLRGTLRAPAGPRLLAALRLNMILIFVCALLLASSLFALPYGTSEDSNEPPRASILAASIINFVASPSRVYVGQEVTFYANATSSNPNATLTFVIFYDSQLAGGANNTASPTTTDVTGVPGNITRTFTYDHVGNLTGPLGTYFLATLYVSDGSTTVSKRIAVYVVENSAPTFSLRLPSACTVSLNVSATFTTEVKDVDNDELTVTWDFGDGTPQAVNLTGPSAAGVAITQSHTWNPAVIPGQGDYFLTFYLNVSVDDGQGHTIQSSTLVSIYIPYNLSPTRYFYVTSNTVDPSDEVVLYANATDPEGDPLTWTFVFNNSYSDYLVVVHHTDPTPPGTILWYNLTHVFSTPGNYTVTFYISDTIPPYQTGAHNLSSKVTIFSVENRLPFVMDTISVSPSDPRINTTLGFAAVTFSIQANDPDGDVLTAIWDFGDSSEPAVNQSSGGRDVFEFVQVHQYLRAGYMNVSLVVTDGRTGHEVFRYRLVTVTSDNQAPRVMSFIVTLSNGTSAVPGSVVELCLVIFDAERDTVDTVWDFGDNSTPISLSSYNFDPDGLVSVEVTHVYEAVGEYTVTVWLTDNMFGSSDHNSSVFSVVRVKIPAQTVTTSWNIWDYVGLGLVFGSFALVVARWVYLGQKRKALDRLGMTLEEYRLYDAARRKELDSELYRREDR